jgi:hypothetical protein
MIIDRTRLLLALKSPHSQEEVRELLGETSFVLEDTDDERKYKTAPRLMERINHTDRRFWIRSRANEPLDEENLNMLKEKFGEDLDWVGPVYQLPNLKERSRFLCPLPNVLVIRPAATNKEADREVRAMLARYGMKELAEKSKYLGAYRYYIIDDVEKQSAYQIRDILEKDKQRVREVRFENMPMIVPTAIVPNDPLFAQQWDMTRIQAGGAGGTGWDISTGVATVVVCVLDEGCDLTHPDLQFSTPGINLGTMMPDGSPTGNHGTACAGIVAATFNNILGVAGVAGNCSIMPLAFQNWTDVEVAAGINFAADNGARIISMSFGWDAWDHAIIDPAIQHAFDSDVVMCVATHNYDGPITYPATNPLVMACGASDQVDNRKSPTSPDGETWWGSDFGPEMSVVAPGVFIPTTDRQGNVGYNTAAGTAGDYFLTFNGTSSATPHVAGLAALLRSTYVSLTNVQVRNIIERTAEKVGVVAYSETAGYPNGTWNQEMGYGRINVLRALDNADVMLKDWAGDIGTEPSVPPGGNFWDFSDIVVRITDDNVFVPDDPSKSRNAERGQTNYLYIRVTNAGPREARNVVVNARITPYVGMQFIYPTDWTAIDATHVSPTPITNTFASIPSGGTAMAKFSISAAQVEDLWGWVSSHPWHPCLLASVSADNDYAFATANLTGGNLVVRRNNLAQRNLSVIDVLAGATATFAFVAGNRENSEQLMEILVDRSKLPKSMKLLLSLDDDGRAFPLVDFAPTDISIMDNNGGKIVFLERTKIEATLGCCRGILTIEKGSRFDCLQLAKIGKVRVKGGEVILRNDKRFVEVKDDVAVVTMEKQPNQIYPFSLQTSMPADAKKDQQFAIRVSQRDQNGTVVGGATVIYMIK